MGLSIKEELILSNLYDLKEQLELEIYEKKKKLEKVIEGINYLDEKADRD